MNNRENNHDGLGRRLSGNPLGGVLICLLGWAAPGVGHLLIGRPIRAAIIFVSVIILFASGMAIGGVFTLNPRTEPWWHYAQLGAGVPAVAANEMQSRKYDGYLVRGAELTGPFSPTDKGDALSSDSNRQRRYAQQLTAWRQLVSNQADALIAADHLALTMPAANPAIIFTAVAGLLNIMCALDAGLLCMMGVYGEGGGKDETADGEDDHA